MCNRGSIGCCILYWSLQSRLYLRAFASRLRLATDACCKFDLIEPNTKSAVKKSRSEVKGMSTSHEGKTGFEKERLSRRSLDESYHDYGLWILCNYVPLHLTKDIMRMIMITFEWFFYLLS